MPIYEYQCQSCGEKFEKLVRSFNNDDAQVVCPECQSKLIQRQLSTFAMVGSSQDPKDSWSSGSPCATGSCASGFCGL